MASLREKLDTMFPEILPDDPNNAINGTKLLAKVQEKLDDEYAENSIRQHFSTMSQEATSRIAKVSYGHGYYLRPDESTEPEEPAPDDAAGEDETQVADGRESQLEEKFRSIFIRYAEQSNQFAMHIEHTRAAHRAAGVNRWKFPDVVLLSWEVGEVVDQGYRLDPNLLEVKTSLGEQPFVLQSVELKVGLTLSSFRENFFQCVSNSKWAHSACLAVANAITDKTLTDELRRLGSSYDVSVVSYGLSDALLESLPTATEILNLNDADFDERIASKITLTRVSTANERAILDWEHIRDLRSQSTEFQHLFEWIAYCLSNKRAYKYNDFQQIQSIEHNTG